MLAISFASAQQPAATGDEAALEEITVTAQRREESLQKAAAAISVVTGEDIERSGVVEPENLNKLVPGVAIGIGGPSTQIYLRGVGSYGTNAFSDPAVQFTVDGIAYGRITGLGGNFFDLERVEVLKGPQGTLYGRNATGGAINVISKKPTQELGAGLTLEGGNYSLKKGNGFVNVPLGEQWALRFAAQVVERDGYQTDGTNDDDSKAARLHLRYAPRDDLSLLLSGSIVSLGGKGFGQVPVRASGYVDNSNPWLGPQIAAPAALVAQAMANNQPPTLFTNGVSYARGELDVEVTSVGAELNVAIGAPGTLTVLANHLRTENRSTSYGPGFLFAPDDEARQLTF
ncbi:MAG: TonB-dependent receptor plug domain-containing protein, partial [Steroidobacteraceae bacterium]|nr:TonB-dependent receptor plug domain-containing protein [Steroidobacteraceae bacterium]